VVMKKSARAHRFSVAAALCCLLAAAAFGADAVVTNEPPAEIAVEPVPPAPSEELIKLEALLQAHELLQQQLRATQLAMEESRVEMQATARRNAEAWSNRVEWLERSLAAQREREQEIIQKANKTMLVAAGTFAGLGFIAMLFTAWLQWRAANRLSDMAASSHMTRSLIPGWSPHSLGAGELPPGSGPDAEGTRLFEAVRHLERLIVSLEHTATPPLKDAPEGEGNGSAAKAGETDTKSGKAARITLLLGKGQSLLNLNDTEEAVVCFDEVLTLDSNNTEALVKKGVALERQRKLNEAIECYDRAIAADSSMTIAYLYKGGIYNRMERFNEALECYEKALHTQEKRRS
jgi:tetratricopeptide (TPR) repeat protein